jgi:histidinol-phosphate aminotransferase
MPSSELVACKPSCEELPEFAGPLGLKVPWVAPDAAQRHDLAAMRAAVTERTSLVYVCNPNNPSGTAVTRDALEAFVNSVPATTPVIVDEAYIDFADGDGVGTVATLASYNDPVFQKTTRDAILGDRTRVHARRSRPVPGGFARCTRRLSR